MSPRIGILGAGQLGHMLCEAARRIGLHTVVASPDADAPALGIADEILVDAFEDPALAAALIERADVVTFEIEAIPGALLDRLEAAEREGRVVVRPGVGILRLLQNKADQKAWMVRNAIPTLPFEVLDADADAGQAARGGLALPLVQKTQRGGYDGQGVQVLRSLADLERLWPVPSIVEPCLDGRRELGVVVARGVDGSLESYAPVEMVFDEARNVLDTMVSPAALAPAVLAEADRVSRRTVEALGGVGVFAVELFVAPDDAVLVNEISPRVHNSGHHTIEAAAVSQFEQHLRAIAGMDLGAPGDERPAVMRNLLYTDALAPLVGAPAGAIATDVEDVFVHWYGKREARPWRKMGHVTCLGEDVEAARERIDAALASAGREAAA